MTAVPPGLRGEITRWLLEISPGVFVGQISARIREHIWNLVSANSGLGSVTMVYPSKNEQRMEFKTCGSPWEIVDYDGFKLVKRKPEHKIPIKEVPRGWSKAAKRRRFAKR